MESIVQKAALAGHVIEDLTFDALSHPRFMAELVGVEKSPEYKYGGYFVFSDLRPGDYSLRVFGERFQPQVHSVTIPVEPFLFDSPPLFDLAPVFDSPGDNELVVVAKTVNGSENKITFDPVILRKEIKKGSRVLATGFSAKILTDLTVGRITQARLNHIVGLAPNSLVRIVRDRSIRLKFDPYYRFPFEVTGIAGKVVLDGAPGHAPGGVEVRLTHINGASVDLDEVAGARIATFEAGGTRSVLGTEKDVVTLTNEHGDYSVYFRPGQLAGTATVRVSFPGYQAETRSIPIAEQVRNRADFHLFRQ